MGDPNCGDAASAPARRFWAKEQSYEDAFDLVLVPDFAGALPLADVSSDPVRFVAGAVGSVGDSYLING
jgi:hypothetical protein